MTGAGGALDALDYDYDSFGNLKSQTRTIQGLDAGTETYEYDALQRLGHTALFGNVGESSPTTTYDYSPDGNIQYKSDANIDGTAANYYYGGQGCGPHAVTKVAYVSGSVGHYCDANGNDIGPNPFGSGDTAVYDFMNLPRRVTGGDFKYDANGNRYRGETVNGTTVYGPGGYERTTIGRTVTQRWELGPVVFTSMSGGAPQPTYVLRDRLGSTIALMADNRSASVLQTRSYDAFGRVRDGNFGRRSNADLGLEVTTLRGFTQHEHLDGGLIHMNGRMYDSLLGRFKSVDPLIQFPANSQSLNPYSYIMNNPLAGMDPTGYAVKPPWPIVQPDSMCMGGDELCRADQDAKFVAGPVGAWRATLSSGGLPQGNGWAHEQGAKLKKVTDSVKIGAIATTHENQDSVQIDDTREHADESDAFKGEKTVMQAWFEEQFRHNTIAFNDEYGEPLEPTDCEVAAFEAWDLRNPGVAPPRDFLNSCEGDSACRGLGDYIQMMVRGSEIGTGLIGGRGLANPRALQRACLAAGIGASFCSGKGFDVLEDVLERARQRRETTEGILREARDRAMREAVSP